MKEFLVYLLSLLVDHPDAVAVEEQEREDGIIHYVISADQEDVGKIIGKEGKIIAAIRNVAKILAIKHNAHIRIDVA